MWRVFAVVRNVNVAGKGIAVVLALLVGSALRLYDVDHQSLWADEGLQYAIASADHLSELLHRVQHRTMHPPLSFIVTHLFLLIHDSDFFLRLPSVLCGILSLLLIYILVKKISSPRLALYALWIVAVSPFHIWYSQEARMYMPLLMLSLLNTVMLLNAVERHRWWWLGYVGTLALGVFVHIFMVFNAVVHVCWLLGFHRHLVVRYLAGGVIAALLAFPSTLHWAKALARFVFAPDTLRVASAVAAGHRVGFGWEAVPYTLFTFGAGFSLGPSIASLHVDRSLSYLLQFLPALLAVGLICGPLLLIGAIAIYRDEVPATTWLCGLGLCLPIASVAMLSLATQFSYNVRYAVIAYPYFAMALGAGCLALGRQRVWLPALALMVVVTLSGVSLFNYFNQPYYAKDHIRDAVTFWREVSPSGALLSCATAGGVQEVINRYLSATEAQRYVHLGRRDLAAKARDFLAAHPGQPTYVLIARDWHGRMERALAETLKLRQVQVYPGVRLFHLSL